MVNFWCIQYEEDGSACQFTTYKDGNGVVAENTVGLMNLAPIISL